MDENFLKLTNATYDLLEYFPEGETMASRTKEKVLVIMENLAFASLNEQEKSNARPKILENINILFGYLAIAKSHNWINPTNYFIICNGYKKIKAQVLGWQEKKENARTQKDNKSVLNQYAPKKQIISKLNKKISERQKKIIEFLQIKEAAQVMDLQMVLPNVTKRTIRRDLDELLDAGRVVRIGEFNQISYKVNV